MEELWELDNYSVGQFSKFLGLSSQALRDYEDAGLIKLARGDNNYRQFKSSDLTFLIYCKTLRNLGFSLQEISEITSGISSDAISFFDKRLIAIQNQLEELTHKLEIVQGFKRNIEQLLQTESKIEVCISSPFGWIPFREDETLFANFSSNELLIDLMSFSPDSKQIYVVKKENFENQNRNYNIGLYMDEEKINNCDLRHSENLVHVPAFVCVTTVLTFNFSRSGERSFNSKDYNFLERAIKESGIREFLSANHLSVINDIFMMDILHTFTDDTDKHYWKAYFPILEIPN